MAAIRHRVGIAATQAEVFAAVSTVSGLAGWWTHDVEGEATPGGLLAFSFGGPEPAAVMEVVASTPDDQVAWRCVQGPDEWVGTILTFDVSSADGETAVMLTHGEWRQPVPFMHHCSTKWGYFLLGLKAGLEGGEATPYPLDQRISSWG